jgi:hypothetical protein
MTAIRTKFTYVRAPRLPRLPTPDLTLSAAIGRPLRSRHRASKAVKNWWVSHTLEATVWTLATALAVVLGILVARF